MAVRRARRFGRNPRERVRRALRRGLLCALLIGHASLLAACNTAMPVEPPCPAPWDLSVVPDLHAAPDLWHPPSSGDPCTTAADCPLGADGGVTCLPLPGGYCTSPCLVARNDPRTRLNPDCPGVFGTCARDYLGENCRALCHASPCRWQYECSAGGLTCDLPIRSCDFRRSGTCPAGNTCVATWSNGNLSSECAPACDVFTASANCNCKLNAFGEGYCAGPRQGGSNFQPGDACLVGADDSLAADCPPGYGCNPINSRCWRFCTEENLVRQCGACGQCVMVGGGVGVCTRSE